MSASPIAAALSAPILLFLKLCSGRRAHQGNAQGGWIGWQGGGGAGCAASKGREGLYLSSISVLLCFSITAIAVAPITRMLVLSKLSQWETEQVLSVEKYNNGQEKRVERGTDTHT